VKYNLEKDNFGLSDAGMNRHRQNDL